MPAWSTELPSHTRSRLSVILSCLRPYPPSPSRLPLPKPYALQPLEACLQKHLKVLKDSYGKVVAADLVNQVSGKTYRLDPKPLPLHR